MPQKKIKPSALTITFFNYSDKTVIIRDDVTLLPALTLQPRQMKVLKDEGNGISFKLPNQKELKPPCLLVWNEKEVSCVIENRKQI